MAWNDLPPEKAKKGWADEPSPQKKEAFSPFESFSAGVANLGNYAPNIVGAGANLAGKVQDLFQGEVLDPKSGKPIDRVNYLTARDETRKELDRAYKENPISYGGGKVASLVGASILAPGSVNPATAGALEGFLSNPGEKEGEYSGPQLGERTLNTTFGYGGGKLLSGVGSLARRGGDRLMQQAVGRTKFSPGVGETLVNEGIVGTKGMMRRQVENKKNAVYQEMIDSVKDSPKTIEAKSIADNIRGLAKEYRINGKVSELDQPTVELIEGAAKDIEGRGAESLADALQRRKIAGSRGFSSVTDQAKQSVVGRISKEEQKGYSGLLKEAEESLKDLDPRYAALAKAAKPLNKEEGLSKLFGLGNALKLTGIGGAGLVGGLPGAAVAGALSTPLGQSVASQGLVRGGKALQESVAPALLLNDARETVLPPDLVLNWLNSLKKE